LIAYCNLSFRAKRFYPLIIAICSSSTIIYYSKRSVFKF